MSQVNVVASKTWLKGGDQADLSVTGTMSDGTTANLGGASIAYTSDSPLAAVDALGHITTATAGDGTAHLKAAVTMAGITVEGTVEVTVDNTAPVSTITLGPGAPNGSGGWYVTSPIITLSASDILSGVAGTEYRIGENGQWQNYLGAYTIDTEGTVTIQVRSADTVGNIEAARSVSYMLDRTAPADPVLSASTAEPVISSVTVTAQFPADAAAKEYKIGENGIWSAYTAPFAVTVNGSVYARGTDAAGNSSGIAALAVNNIVGTLSASTAAPGKPSISNDNGYDNGLQDGSFNVTMNLYYGQNGRIYRLYENDMLIDTKVIADHTPGAQSVTTAVYGKPNGVYRYYADLTNALGMTRSDTHTVTVTHASPAKPALSNDNWDGDGSFTVKRDMWWGTNGVMYNLYENGALIYSQPLAANTPNAQTASKLLSGRPIGVYEYRAELVNHSGTASSDVMMVKVIK